MGILLNKKAFNSSDRAGGASLVLNIPSLVNFLFILMFVLSFSGEETTVQNVSRQYTNFFIF